MHAWLAAMVTAPRWFLTAMCIGSSLFTLAMGYLAGYAAGRR